MCLHIRHGAQNAYDGASKATLENEFGTSNEDECMIKILEKGDLQQTEVSLDVQMEMYMRLADEPCTRRVNVRDQRMRLWELARLTEPRNLHI